jgi:hypothetical protein
MCSYAALMPARAFIAALALALLFVPGTAIAAPPGPYLTTGAADQITDTSARVVIYVNGNPQGTDIPSQCWIDYGTTLAYGSRKDIVCAGTAYETLTGLTPGTTYYYQLGACNSDGTGHSPTYKSFTTLGATSSMSVPPSASVAASCGPPPGGGPSTPPPGSATLAVTKAQHISTVAKRGVRLRLTLPATCPCTVSAELRVSKKTAKRLHLSSRRLGSVKRKGLLGKATVTVEVKSAAAKRLRRARGTVSVEARASVADAQGHTTTATRPLKLRR